MIHRVIILKENGQVIARNDENNINSNNDYLELELFKFMMVLQDKKLIDTKLIMNMLRIEHNKITPFIIIDILKNPNDWKIFTDGVV